MLDEAKRVDEFLRRYPAFDAARHSRISQCVRAVISGDAALIPPDRQDFPVVQQSMRDLAELAFILDVVGDDVLADIHHQTVCKVFSDHPLPSEAAGRTPGRDHQFELFIFAILKRGGMRPSRRDVGADFEARIDGRSVSVEAKRLKSLERLDDRMRDAAGQLARSGHAGFICMDISAAVGVSDSVSVYNAPVNVRAVQPLRMRHFLQRHRTVLNSAIGERPVYGIVFVDSLIVQHGVQPDNQTGNWIVEHLFDQVYWPLDAPASRELTRCFFRAFTFGLPRYRPDMYAGL